MGTTTTAEVTPANQVFYNKTLLARAVPEMPHGRWGQQKPISKKSGNQIKFRKYNALATATTPLTEGVTPTGKELGTSDITATLAQYGDFVTLSDVVDLVNQDPVLIEAGEVLGEQAGQTIDEIIRDILVAGTNVQYANGSARTAVNTTLTAGKLNTAIRTLRRQNAKFIKGQLNASTGIGTTPIRKAYIGIIHVDTEAVLEGITGYKTVSEYPAQMELLEGEVGSYKNIRFVTSTNAKVWPDVGVTTGLMISTTGTDADVYGTLIIAQDAYGIVPLAGEAMKNIVKPIGSSGAADPIDQRGSSGWKAMTTAKILNENWIIRIEHGNTDAL